MDLEAILGHMADGWFTVQRTGRGSWYLPLGPRPIIRSGLRIYRPTTARGKNIWRVATALAPFALPFMPNGDPPPAWLRARLAPLVPTGGTFAAVRSWHAQRFYALVLDRSGDLILFCKIGRGKNAEEALQREARVLGSLQKPLSSRVAVPRLLGHESGLLLMAPVRWTLRGNDHILPLEVVETMGVLWRNGRGELEPGTSHGDFSPANILPTGDGWVIVDWERATTDLEPFTDMLHYLVQSHVARRHPSAEDLLEGILGSGFLAPIFIAYARSAGLDLADLPSCFKKYLLRSRAWRREGLPGWAARSALLGLLEARQKPHAPLTSGRTGPA